ncbi:MAG: CYTH domain-containing protein [Lachnospiraceae bacterium]|nr:CYTH domain-containing protein [Lachnospiraceae bacterium]
MEIERKYLIDELPADLDSWNSRYIEQGYICENPVLRIRHSEDNYNFVYKSSGLMAHEEITVPLDRESYNHLAKKVDGKLIKKTRYTRPLKDFMTCEEAGLTLLSKHPEYNGLSELRGLIIELDVFENVNREDGAPLWLAEIEFPSEEVANAFKKPQWFGEDVTMEGKYHNSQMIWE